mmetsp:Transcript_14791/g.24739  ORF Transcript_14791/g.24739 Transcript_14791/m.24739 type:complete len:225 (+) Transcript_14791:31-705(+)|eukprot:jgi/Bigna1/86122/estExt_fgenesh1_pg.C_80134
MPLRLVPTLFAFLAAVGRANKSAYNNSVLDPSHIENQVWAQVFNPHYGLHVFALGKNQSLFHKFQIGNASKITDSVPFSKWHCLTPNASLTFDTDPAAAVNANGQIEVFARMSEFIDLWQIYQQDPKDPLSFSKAREGTCMCPAVSPEDCPWCISCVADPDCDKQYFSNHAPFPTSAASVLMRPDRRLQVNFRGFDGQMYGLIQNRSGDPTKYVQGPVYAAVFE